MTRTRLAIIVGMAVVVSAAAGAWVVASRLTPEPTSGVPMAAVTRGILQTEVHLTGDLQASRSIVLVPPPAGGPLRLVKLVETGTAVKAGDVVMEFDPADQRFTLEQNRSQLAEAEQQIIKMRADTEVRASQAAVDLLTARFDVRRAEMDASAPANFIGTIEARNRALALDEAKRRLAELEGLIGSRQDVDRAQLTTLEQRRNTARITAERAGQIIEQLVVHAPADGLVVIRENRDTTNMFYTGMVLPEYRVGDTVLPGRNVLEIINPDLIVIRARVTEQDRPILAPGLAAVVQAGALPGERLSAQIESVAGLASRQPMDGATPIKRFDTTLKLVKPEPRLRPGTSVKIVVAGKELTGILHAPRQAVFERDGQTVVFVREGDRFVPKPIKVSARTASRVAIDGVAEGTLVALIDPTKVTTVKPATPGSPIQ